MFTLLLFTSSAIDKTDQAEESSAKIKAIYIYNFTKYIEWPQSYKVGNFVIGVIGSNTTILNELSKMANSKKVGNQKLEIRNINSCSPKDQFNIIYLLPDNSSQLSDILKNIKGKSTLIVTDKTGLAKKGAAINFFIEGNKQKIELNRNNLETHKLKVASTLVEMALVIK